MLRLIISRNNGPGVIIHFITSTLCWFCFILDSPKLQSGGDGTIFFSALGQNTTLSVIVSAVPDITGHVIWSRPDSNISEIQPTKSEHNLFQSKLHIETVKEADYGIYTVNVSNGIGNRSIFILTLNQSGKSTTKENHNSHYENIT